MHPSDGILSCCGQPMDLLIENAKDAALEKHCTVIDKIDGGYKVTVGSVEHPMLQEHHIEWIELITENQVMRKYLHPGEKPVAVFMTDAMEVTAREYCNIHGHWKSCHLLGRICKSDLTIPVQENKITYFVLNRM